MFEKVTIDKLVHGGQGLARLADGKKVFVWNALPGEIVKVRIIKKRKDYCEAVTEELVDSSPDRIEPKDDAYLSTSPWQILSWSKENESKQNILTETMQREGVHHAQNIDFYSGGEQWQYRNKMEYSFWADDKGLHLALYGRGTHTKQIASGSSLAKPQIDETAAKITAVLNKFQIRGSQLKTIIVRADQSGNTVAALFVKDEKFPEILELEQVCRGIEVCYSTPKSPASVITKVLRTYGDIILQDKIIDTTVRYNVHSFFQVNVPVFEQAVKRIDYFLTDPEKVDLYSGVGSIGVAIGNTKTFVDVDATNCEFARQNVPPDSKVVQASSETALEYISSDRALIIDPPRSGLHRKLIDKILEVRPPTIAYLSCNPSTQARDIVYLQSEYQTKLIEGYNFFPKTPHIESLAVMIRK